MGNHGRPRVDDHRVLSGMIFLNRNGMQQCDVPKDAGRQEPSATAASAGDEPRHHQFERPRA